jgi:hypothetical protein
MHDESGLAAALKRHQYYRRHGTGQRTNGDFVSRIFLAIAIAFLNLSVAIGQNAKPTRDINLNAPGAMEKVQASNPQHYKKIQSILDGIDKHSPGDARRWIQTTYNAKDVGYSFTVLTTSPGQRQLSFTLDKTRYRAVVTLERGRAEIYPVKSP